MAFRGRLTGPSLVAFIGNACPGETLNKAPLVGRSPELAAIVQLASRAEAGAGSLLSVAGEGGIGKTRLVELVGEQLARKGWMVASGRAYPVERGVPFAIFSDALLPTLKSYDAATLTVLSRGATELKSIFPTLNGISSYKGSGDDPGEYKARMLWSFSQLLGRLAHKQPLLLILENLQWADESSLELLHFVARNAGGQRLLVLGTYNLTERDSNEILKSTEQSLTKIAAATRMELSALSESQVSELIQHSFEVRPEAVEKFGALVYAWTHGNPFFVEEILKELVATGRLRKSGSGWTGWDMNSLALPATVKETIEGRIGRLSHNAGSIASLAAVIGNRVTFDTLLKVSALSETDGIVAIDELRAQKIIQENAGPVPEYEFAHPLFQQVLYSAIGAARAGVMHASVADALERKYARQSDLHADELAYHYARVHTPETNPKAIHYMRAAGLTALARFANREAVSYLGSALQRADSTEAATPPAEKAVIIAGLARALQRTGEYAQASALWIRSRDEALALDDLAAVAVAEHRIGLGAYWSANLSDALSHFDSALEAAEAVKDDALAVRIHLARAIVLQDVGDVRKAKTGVEAALKIAERKQDNVLRARVHRALLLLYAWAGPKEKARLHGQRALEFAEASNQKMLEWTAHWGMSVLSGLSGDASGVARHLARAEALNEDLQSPILPIWTAEISVQYLSGTGDWEKGLEHGERAIEMARTFGQRSLLPRLLVWTALIHLWRGDTTRARPLLDEAWSLSRAGSPRLEGEIPAVVPAHYGIASFHLHTRNYPDAIAVGEAGLAIADKAGYDAWALQWLLPVVGEAALWARQWEKAEMHSKRMRADAARLDHPLGLAWADACDGLLTMLRDNDPAAGAELLRSAAEKMDALQIPAAAAVLRRHLGRALIDSGNTDAARRELKRAHDVLAKLGARSELDAVRDQLRGLGSRPPAKATSSGAAGLTGRELEIARMVAERKSNKEIGAALDISARTVSTHLSNIFLKLGVDSRGALTDFIREKAL